MPDDLKNFYMTNNGFTLTWSVKMNGNGKSYYFILISVNYVVDIVFGKAQLVDFLMDWCYIRILSLFRMSIELVVK